RCCRGCVKRSSQAGLIEWRKDKSQERAMGAVMVRCPQTGRNIPTGLTTDRESFEAMPVFFARVHCPICRTEHEWFAKEAWVLEKMAADALEMSAVKRALNGVDVVIQSLGVSPGPEVIFRPTRFFSKATRLLVTAMEQAHVKRLICVTGFGAGDSRG